MRFPTGEVIFGREIMQNCLEPLRGPNGLKCEKEMLRRLLQEYFSPFASIYRWGPSYNNSDLHFNIGDAETGIQYSTVFCIGTSDAGIVYVFIHKLLDKFNFVAMKTMTINQEPARKCEKLFRDVQRSVLVTHHPNILGIKTTFTDHIYENELYVAMPYMELGSLRSIMTYGYNNGLSEESIAVALKQTLMGLSHLHQNGQLHRDINAGRIFFSHYNGIKLAFAATVYEHCDNSARCKYTTLSVSNAAAPEVFYSKSNDEYTYTVKADIWLIGITALELAYGGIRASGRRGLEKMIKKITKKNKLPPKRERGRGLLSSFFKPLIKPCCGCAADLRSLEFSECFGKMVAKCLATEPVHRPTAFELLEDEFFKNCSSENVKHFLTKSTPLYPRELNG